MTAYLAIARLVAVLAVLAGAFAGGWQAKAILADRDALQVQNEALKGLADATKSASDAADEYARRRDAVEPQIRIVRVQAAPIVRELDRCPMPADAGRVLRNAADAADSTPPAGSAADAAGSAPGQREPDSGRPVRTDNSTL